MKKLLITIGVGMLLLLSSMGMNSTENHTLGNESIVNILPCKVSLNFVEYIDCKKSALSLSTLRCISSFFMVSPSFFIVSKW